MNKILIIKSVDELLRPLGFSRRNKTWNRKSPPFIDVIDIQISHLTDQVTINAGVIHREIYQGCWGSEARPFVQEPYCIVRTRIGQLIDNYDIWWPLNQPDAVVEMPSNIKKYVLPFLEKMHSFENMAEYLYEANKRIISKYPPDVIFMALLKSKLGDHEGACEIILDYKRKFPDAWAEHMNRALEMIKKENSNSHAIPDNSAANMFE